MLDPIRNNDGTIMVHNDSDKDDIYDIYRSSYYEDEHLLPALGILFFGLIS